MSALNVRKRILYGGRVQGVGFRATCRAIAADHNVGGHVRNLVDGRVELVVEGPAPAIQRVLDAIAQQMEGNIRAATVETEPVRGERQFRIAR